MLCDWQLLNNRGGVALVPKQHVADVVQSVKWTNSPAAIVTTENPDVLGLRGFPRTQVFCTVSYMGDNAVREEAVCQRWLTQLGYGEPVRMILEGPQVTVYTSMQQMIIKFDPTAGWPDTRIPVSIISETLGKIVDLSAQSEIQPREFQSASFLLHSDYVDVALQHSGKDGVYIKERKGTAKEMELLWLPAGTTAEGAQELAKGDNVYGFTKKGPPLQPRFAIRFRTLQALTDFAAKNHIESNALLARWKLSGTHVSMGLHGALAFLTEQRWADVEILYVAEHQVVFVTSNVGHSQPCHYTYLGVPRQLRYKALNTKAREMHKQANQTAAAASAAAPAAREKTNADRQKEFLARVQAARPKQPTQHASPRKAEQEKREAIGRTGETPEGKESRKS